MLVLVPALVFAIVQPCFVCCLSDNGWFTFCWSTNANLCHLSVPNTCDAMFLFSQMDRFSAIGMLVSASFLRWIRTSQPHVIQSNVACAACRMTRGCRSINFGGLPLASSKDRERFSCQLFGVSVPIISFQQLTVDANWDWFHTDVWNAAQTVYSPSWILQFL